MLSLFAGIGLSYDRKSCSISHFPPLILSSFITVYISHMEESQISELPDDPKALKIMLADLLRRLHNAQHTIHSQNEALEASHKQVLLLPPFSTLLLFLRQAVIHCNFKRLKFMLWSSGK